MLLQRKAAQANPFLHISNTMALLWAVDHNRSHDKTLPSCLTHSSTAKKETENWAETLIPVYQTTRHRTEYFNREF
jgi:dsRNA-specific ribonuclease